MRKFILYFMVFGIFFIAFDKPIPASIRVDIEAGSLDYVYNFDEVTEEGKRIVLFDNRGLEHSQYYVFDFSGDQYVYYTYYYMGDSDKYNEKYSEVVSKIVDYNYEEYMIKTVEQINYGTYESVMEELSENLENDLLYIIY